MKDTESIQSILFLCNENSLRSPMAEAIVKNTFDKEFFVDSAGVSASSIHPLAIEIMAEWGIDMSQHQSKSLDDLDDYFFDIIITLSPEAHHRALTLADSNHLHVEYWPTYDPSDNFGNRNQMLNEFRNLRDYLKTKIIDRFS